MFGFGPCHHMEEVLLHPEQVRHWQAIASGRPVNWQEVFAGYCSQVDWPGAHVWRDLAAAFPKAKVIHTTRPEEQWWRRFSATIAVLLGNFREMPAPPHICAMMEVASKMIRDETLGGAFTDKESALTAYRRREQEVRAAFPPERLRVFDVAEGWTPLCQFLDARELTTTFPRVISAEEWWKLIKGEPH